MLVDDEPDILGFMEMALREEGYEVVAAISGAEALAAIDVEPPGLILLDDRCPRWMEGSSSRSSGAAEYPTYQSCS